MPRLGSGMAKKVNSSRKKKSSTETSAAPVTNSAVKKRARSDDESYEEDITSDIEEIVEEDAFKKVMNPDGIVSIYASGTVYSVGHILIPTPESSAALKILMSYFRSEGNSFKRQPINFKIIIPCISYRIMKKSNVFKHCYPNHTFNLRYFFSMMAYFTDYTYNSTIATYY